MDRLEGVPRAARLDVACLYCNVIVIGDRVTVQGTVKAVGETKVMEVPWAVLPLAQMREK